MKKLTSLLILMIFTSSILFAQSTTNNGQMVEKKSYKIEKIDSGTPLIHDIDLNAVTNPHTNTFTDDLFDHQFDFICGDASGEAGIETNGDYIYTSKWNGDGFFCYEMDGTFLGWFPVAGEAAVRDMAYDGTYFYGAAASTALYEMDFVGMSGTLISTLTAAVATRACAYDAEFDGFWGNNWSDPITLYDRTGGILNQFNCGAYSSYYGFARLNDAGTEYLYGFAQSGGASQSTIVQIDPYTGVETGVTFDAIGYSSTGTGIAGGLAAFDTYAPGWWTLLGIIQNETIFGVEGGIAGPPPVLDLKLTGIPEPNSGLGLGVENIVIGVKNVGSETQSNFDVQYRVDMGTWVTETIAGPLAMGESVTYTFNAPYDFSAFGTYFIEAEVILAGDENPENNSGDKTITNTDPSAVCYYSITMWDDYGDGWNGGAVQLLCDGEEVFNGTLASGAGPETYEFLVYDATFLVSVWTAGGWPYECSYEIYDADGNSIFQDGFGGVDPVGGDVGIVDCEGGPGCVVECPTGGIPEGEECPLDEYVDNFNGGCNSEPPIYSPIACGEVICGTGSTYLFEGSNFRDTDWYELTIAEPSTIYWNAEAEFPVAVFILDATVGDCDNIIVLSSGTADPCVEVQIEASVGPGTYWLFVAPSEFEGYPCDGENNDYVVSVECVPYVQEYCDASTVTEDEWIALVECGTIYNQTGWQGGVGDYTDQFTIIPPGVAEPILVTNGNPWASDNVTCWVDWNDDMEWTQGGDEEFVLTNDGTGAFFDGFITPPAGTPMGEYRMRVRMTYSVAPFPCGEASYGEVEDYTIVVGQGASYDAGVTAILSPVSGELLGIEPVTVTVKNFGSEILPEIPVGYNLDMAGWVDEVVPGPIDPGAEVEYTFNQPVDLTAFGTYALEACTFLPGDENVANDCAAAIIENTEPMTGCMWTVTLWDDYGDGWNGGILQIFADGVEIFNGTIETGAGPETYEFNVQGGEFLVAVYTPGGWPYENSYAISDNFGIVVFEDGMGGVEPVGGDIGYAYCELPSCEWSVTLWDDYGDGWNGGLLEIYGGADLLWSGTLETGAGPETYYYDVYEGTLLTAVYTAGGWPYENEYIVYDAFGNPVFEDGMGGVEPTGGEIGIAYCDEPLFPEITVDPTSFDVTVDVGATAQDFLNIGNIGEGVLDYIIGVTFGPTETTLPTNINEKIEPNAYMTDKDPIANSDWDYDCPAGSVISQPCPDYSTAMTADEAGYYDFYQSFAGGGDIEGIRFWGIDAIFDGGWAPCTGTEPKTFHIGFYADDAGQPGAMIDEFTIPVPRTNTGDLFASTYTMWEYEVAFPYPVSVMDGWFSVMALIDPAPCWFLTLNAPNGAGTGQQWDGTAWNAQDPMGFCLLGEAVIPWLVVDPLAGSVDPQGSDVITLDFNAGDYPAGTVLTANIAIASNDPVTPIVDVPVQMTVASSGAEQTFDLDVGYQFISSGVDPADPDMMVVMADVLNDNLDFVRNSTGQMLRKIGPVWVNGIGDWIVEEGYLVKMFAADSFTINGIAVPPGTPIDVEIGYQFVSYFPDAPMDALIAFETIVGPDLDFIRNSAGGMLRKIGPVWVNGIGDALPGEGYLVKMFAPGQIIYPEPVKLSGKTTINPSHLLFEGGNAAEPVYTMYIDGLEIGDEVAAYNGDVILGSMTVSSDNVYSNALAVFAQLTNGQGYVAGELIALKVWSNNNVVMAEFEMESVYNSYVSNFYPDNDGEFSVVNITKGAALTGELVVYPNPATNMINISSPNQINSVVIYNYVGQSVYEGNSTQINTSNFESGVYIIRIETAYGVETQKVTIK